MMPGPKRTQEGVKLVALQPKPKRGKKAAVVEKTTEQKTEKERTYHQWTPDENSILVEWFENPENYARWKFSGKTNKASGRLNTTPVTRASLEREIHQYMSSKDVARDLTSVIGKIKSIENSWKKAHDELVKQTGSGIDDLNERMQAADIRELILRRCPMWDRLNPIYCQRPSMVAPHTSDNLSEVNFATDSVLANDTFNDILTEEQIQDFFAEDIPEDTSAYPVYGESSQPATASPAAGPAPKGTTGNTNRTVAFPHLSANKPKREEKKSMSTADTLREISRDRLTMERERLEIEKRQYEDNKNHRLAELEDRDKQRKFELEKLEKETELARLKLQTVQAQNTN